MNNKTYLVHLEPSLEDSQITKQVIKNSDFKYIDYQRIETLDELVESLESFRCDLVISEYRLGGYDCLQVLSTVRIYNAIIPVLVLTGKIEIEDASGFLMSGIDDFIDKHHLARLLPAISRSLRDLDSRREKELMEEELRKSEKKFRSLIEGQGEGILYVNEHDIITYANPAAENIFGTKSGRLVGKNISSFVDEVYYNNLDKDNLVDDVDSQSYELNIENMKGEKKIILFTSTPQYKESTYYGDFCIVRDITKRKRAEIALQESEDRFRALSESAQDAIIMLNQYKEIVFWNRAAEKIFGYPKEEILRQSIEKLFYSPQLIHQLLFSFSNPLESTIIEGITEELIACRKDGESFPISISLSYTSIKDKLNYIGIARDISESMRIKEELRKSHYELQDVLENIRDVFYRTDKDGNIIKINRAGLELFKYDNLNDIIGINSSHFYPDIKDKEYFDNLMQRDNIVYRLEETLKNRDGELLNVLSSSHYYYDKDGNVQGVEGVITDITKRKKSEVETLRLSAAVKQSDEAMVITDIKGILQYVNPAFERLTGYSSKEVIGKHVKILKSDEHKRDFYLKIWSTVKQGLTWTERLVTRRKDGSIFETVSTISSVKDDNGKIVNYVSVMRDVSKLAMMETQLRQAQKLESIGQLAAGIAHELNTPIQYVGDNLRFMKESFIDILDMYKIIQDIIQKTQDKKDVLEEVNELNETMEDIDFSFLAEEIPLSIDQSLEGTDRVASIVKAMKEFSHPSSDEKVASDLNNAIQSTITVARNEWKYVAELITNFDDKLPLVPCLLSEFNQVILNLIVNAAHSIEEKLGVEPEQKGKITIKTKAEDGYAIVSVSDTGKGIPKKLINRIFDPFFTTKEVGKGTGQGLAISRNVIVDKHKGQLMVDSEPDKGSVFTIHLPYE